MGGEHDNALPGCSRHVVGLVVAIIKVLVGAGVGGGRIDQYADQLVVIVEGDEQIRLHLRNQINRGHCGHLLPLSPGLCGGLLG